MDFSGIVDDEFLEKLGLEKGTRKLVNHEERGRVLRAMDGCSYKAAAGGSLSNSLVALARLGSRSIGGSPLNVAMAGSVGSDPLGGFYRSGSSNPERPHPPLLSPLSSSSFLLFFCLDEFNRDDTCLETCTFCLSIFNEL